MHKFEDGFVERTCAVVVEGNKATVQYQIGLNEKTIQDLLVQWTDNKPKSVSETSQPSETSDPKQKEDQQVPVLERNQNAKQIEAKPGTAANSNRNPKTKKSKKIGTENDKAKPKLSPDAKSKTQLNDSENGVEEDVITIATLDKFQSVAGQEVAKRFKVTCNKKLIPVKNIKVEKAPRHPFVLLIKFELELPVFETGEVVISDENFRQQTGAVRYALKGTGDTMLLKSNVAPIVIRAKRIELSGLSAKETADKTSISARLAIMSTSK